MFRWVAFDELPPLPTATESDEAERRRAEYAERWRVSKEVMAARVAKGRETRAKNAEAKRKQQAADAARGLSARSTVAVRWTVGPQPNDINMKAWTPETQYAEFARSYG